MEKQYAGLIGFVNNSLGRNDCDIMPISDVDGVSDTISESNILGFKFDNGLPNHYHVSAEHGTLPISDVYLLVFPCWQYGTMAYLLYYRSDEKFELKFSALIDHHDSDRDITVFDKGK